MLNWCQYVVSERTNGMYWVAIRHTTQGKIYPSVFIRLLETTQRKVFSTSRTCVVHDIFIREHVQKK